MRRMENETTELQLREPPPWLRLHLAAPLEPCPAYAGVNPKSAYG